MSTRRLPPTVYSSKRRQRSISNPHFRPVPSSSPLKPPANDADISVEEMSRRMMKRSRSGLKRSSSGSGTSKSASVGASPIDRSLEDARPAKRSKASVRVPLQTIVEPSGNMPPEEEDIADVELTDAVELKTPVPRVNPEKQNDATMNEESDFLSPLPSSRLAKRVIAHRTSSSNLAENKNKRRDPSSGYMLMSPATSDLASPFHSRPGSPSPNRYDVKNALKKKLNRTRSVGTDLRRRATMRSFSRAVSPASSASSPGARRHPSLPSSQGNQKENQDWLVPARFKQPLGQATPRRPSDTSVPFVRESSFFDSVPEACSTPVNVKRTSTVVPPTPGRDIDATPRVPLGMRSSTAFTNNPTCFLPDEPTPRARPSVETDSSALPHAEDFLFPDSPTIPTEDPAREQTTVATPLNTRRRLIDETSEECIFSSSSGPSASVLEKQHASSAQAISDKTTVEPKSVTLAPPSSPVVTESTSPPSSEGDELRDMFSILGLDEDEHWLASSFSRTESTLSSVSSASVAKNAKKKKGATPQRKIAKQDVIGAKGRISRGSRQTPVSSVSQAPRRRKRLLIKPDTSDELNVFNMTVAEQLKDLSTVKMKILDEPIQSTDSSDEIDFLKGCSGQNSSPSNA